MNTEQPFTTAHSALTELYDQTSTLEGLLEKDRYINPIFLAKGAIKQIYRVTDTHCGRDIALAQIKEELLDWEQSLEFIREVQLTSSFEHPNIIRVYDIGIDDDTPWFTMELTSGRTLVNVIKEQPLSLNQRLSIISDICDAIHYAHERETLHLDLKPENISIGDQGQILIGDWGIASSIAKRSLALPVADHTLNTYIKGTPGFMAPEQTNADFTPARSADIFGIGALFYYILTGESPIQGDSSQVKLTSTRTGRFNSFDRDEIPHRIKPIITKALARIPSKRYQSAAEIKSDIEKFQDGFATEAESTSFPTLAKLFLQRHKTSCALISIFLLILLGSSVYFASNIKKEKEAVLSEQEKVKTLSSQLLENQQKLASERQALASAYFNDGKGFMKQGKLKAATTATQKALELEPHDEITKRQLSILLFCQQKFVEAANMMPPSAPPRFQKLADIAQKHQYKLMRGNALVQFLEQLPNEFSNYRRLLFIHDGQTSKKQAHLVVVAHMLKRQNKQLDSPNIQWDAKTQTLDLSNNPNLKTTIIKETPYSPRINLLEKIPTKTLILDDTPHNRLNGIKFLPNKKCELLFKSLPQQKNPRQPLQSQRTRTSLTWRRFVTVEPNTKNLVRLRRYTRHVHKKSPYSALAK